MNIISLTKPSKKYIHYGSDHFDKDRFIKIKNCSMPQNKPACDSGLWASPINSKNGWRNWCLRENFETWRLEKSFIFELKPEAKILYIRNDKELRRALDSGLLMYKNYASLNRIDDYYMDFEQLVHDGYDAIEIHINSLRIVFGLYGWDCDSLLVLNPDCIVM